MTARSGLRSLGLALGVTMFGCSTEDAARPTTKPPPQTVQSVRNDGDSAVVLVTRASGYSCTGTLVTPSFVLTASHCVPGPRDMAGGSPLFVYLGDESGVRGHRIGTKNTHLPPQTDGDENDIAMIELERPVVGITPMRVALEPLTQGMVEPLRVVGYGSTSSGAAGPPVRRSGVAHAHLTRAHVNTSPGTAPCHADSGGPGLGTTLDGNERIVGVASSVEGGRCENGSFFVRTDRHRAFIARFTGEGSEERRAALSPPSRIAVSPVRTAPVPKPILPPVAPPPRPPSIPRSW